VDRPGDRAQALATDRAEASVLVWVQVSAQA
jgi:hypothetical protein